MNTETRGHRGFFFDMNYYEIGRELALNAMWRCVSHLFILIFHLSFLIFNLLICDPTPNLPPARGEGPRLTVRIVPAISISFSVTSVCSLSDMALKQKSLLLFDCLFRKIAEAEPRHTENGEADWRRNNPALSPLFWLKTLFSLHSSYGGCFQRIVGP